MKKIAMLLIALILISVVFLSGCNAPKSTENTENQADLVDDDDNDDDIIMTIPVYEISNEDCYYNYNKEIYHVKGTVKNVGNKGGKHIKFGIILYSEEKALDVVSRDLVTNLKINKEMDFHFEIYTYLYYEDIVDYRITAVEWYI